MSENKNSVRRRKAFADFKENQYDASFSLSKEQKRKKRATKIFKWIFTIIIIALFVAAGFILTDALLDISEQPYEDGKTYTASFTTTAAQAQTTASQADSSNDEKEESTDASQESTDVTQENGENTAQQSNGAEQQ